MVVAFSVVCFDFIVFLCVGPSYGLGSGDAWDMFKRRSWSLGRDKRKHQNKGLHSHITVVSRPSAGLIINCLRLANFPSI